MSYTAEKSKNSTVIFTIVVQPDDYLSYLQKAAQKLSERTAVRGFRKGKVPFNVMKKEVGEMAIMQEAIESIIQKTFYDAVRSEGLETVGMPKIEIEKLAPGNDIIYKATVAMMPKVELADISKIKVEKKVKPVEDKKIAETLEAIRRMHAVEVLKDGPAENTDKLIIDMDMLLDNVPIEGGQAKDYQVYLSEDHYIPGFNARLIGMKKGDKKEFSLNFPEGHYQKMLAGKKVDFKIKVKNVYERRLPELSDDLAKKLGQDSLEKLKSLIKGNMEREAEQKAEQAVEIEILNALIDGSDFDVIPDVIIDAERQKMFYELKRDLERNGVSIDDYLRDIKKTEEEIFNDFKTQAERRAKAAIISRQIALDNEIKVNDEEVNGEIKMMEEVYKNNPEYLENLKRREVRKSIAVALQNKKVMKWLKEKTLGEA